MKIFWKCPIINMSYNFFRLVICIDKNFIWTTLKMIFSIFSFFCSLRFQIFNSCISVKYCPILTNHTSMKDYVFSFQIMFCQKLTLMTGFVVQGHMTNNLNHISGVDCIHSAQACCTVYCMKIWSSKIIVSITIKIHTLASPYEVTFNWG